MHLSGRATNTESQQDASGKSYCLFGNAARSFRSGQLRKRVSSPCNLCQLGRYSSPRMPHGRPARRVSINASSIAFMQIGPRTTFLLTVDRSGFSVLVDYLEEDLNFPERRSQA